MRQLWTFPSTVELISGLNLSVVIPLECFQSWRLNGEGDALQSSLLLLQIASTFFLKKTEYGLSHRLPSPLCDSPLAELNPKVVTDMGLYRGKIRWYEMGDIDWD